MTSESSAGASVMSWEERTVSKGECDASLVRECKEAEERHRKEMRGWMVGAGAEDWRTERANKEEKRLWGIRWWATTS